MKISAVETAVPGFKASPDEVIEAAREWLGQDSAEYNLFLRYLRSSKTLNRNFIRPPLEIVRLKGSHYRARLFESEAPKLAIEAARSTIEAAQIDPKTIGALIFTSCTCPLIPAPDTHIIDHLGLRRDIIRLPSYQFGCAGGVIGLGLANRFGRDSSNVLLVSAELCSLVFQRDDRTAAQLVGASIFGDGAAAALLSANKDTPGISIIDHQSFLIPESRHLMGYDIQDDGANLLLDKELPMHLADWAPRLIDGFLAKHRIARAQVPWWLFHPGGTKILNFLSQSLELNLFQARWAGETLQSHGNLSSATILFVLKQFIDDNEAQVGDYVMIVGVGPGLTIEIVLGRVDGNLHK